MACTTPLAGEIRDLIVLKARSCKLLMQITKLRLAHLIGGLDQLTPIAHQTKACTRLDREQIGRDVLHIESQRTLDRAFK